MNVPLRSLLLFQSLLVGYCWDASLLRASAAALAAIALDHITITNPMPPSDQDNQLVQMAFRDFDLKRLDASDKEFSIAIDRWKELKRPRDELVSLLKARYNQLHTTDRTIIFYNCTITGQMCAWIISTSLKP